MLRLHARLASTLRAGAASPLPAASLLRRLLCSDASPDQLVSESYLVSSCGLTPSQALKVSRSIPNTATAEQADAVRAFLAKDLGLSQSDVASTIARSARMFGLDVEKTLAPCVARLRDIGLSTPEIARLVPLVPSVFVSAKHVSRLEFYMSYLGSFAKVHMALRRNTSLLCSSIERVVKPNFELMEECGVPVRDIAHLVVMVPRLIAGSKERLEEVLVQAEQLGVARGTPMFRYAVVGAYSVGRAKAAAKMELLRSLGMSNEQVAMAVAKMPFILSTSEERLRRAMEFLTKEAGLDMDAIARGPALLKFSIEGRLVPRLKVLELLKDNGVSGGKWRFYAAACLSDEQFIERYVSPYEKSIPALTAVYAAARSGKAKAGADTS